MSQYSSTVIGAKSAQTNYYAEEQAIRIKLPFTHLVTINYSNTQLPPKEATRAFAKLRSSYFVKWANRKELARDLRFAPTYVFAFENARDGVAFNTMEDGDPHNVHVHWAVHIPEKRFQDFENLLWGWVEKTTGGINDTEAINIKPSNGRLSGYLVKGTTKTNAERYARGRQAEPQGIIFGRRADTSRNLGPTKRRATDQILGISRKMPRSSPV